MVFWTFMVHFWGARTTDSSIRTILLTHGLFDQGLWDKCYFSWFDCCVINILCWIICLCLSLSDFKHWCSFSPYSFMPCVCPELLSDFWFTWVASQCSGTKRKIFNPTLRSQRHSISRADLIQKKQSWTLVAFLYVSRPYLICKHEFSGNLLYSLSILTGGTLVLLSTCHTYLSSSIRVQESLHV